MTLFDQSSDAPTRRIVEHLQRRGAASIRELEGVLGVTTTAVRAHLSALLAEGYIERRAVHKGVGRPHHAYALTGKARDLYACHCDDLALTLLQEVFAVEGVERAAYLLGRVGDRLAERYAGSVQGDKLRLRVEQMAQVLENRGVLTDVEAPTAGDNLAAFTPFDAAAVDAGDVLVLRAYNCPFHDLAQEHREICEMDERMLTTVLGAEVTLSSCMMDGAQGCSFVVRAPANGTAPKGATVNGQSAHAALPPAAVQHAEAKAEKSAKGAKEGKKKKRKKGH
jgi:predicted ArsR family transcriptional regulator